MIRRVTVNIENLAAAPCVCGRVEPRLAAGDSAGPCSANQIAIWIDVWRARGGQKLDDRGVCRSGYRSHNFSVCPANVITCDGMRVFFLRPSTSGLVNRRLDSMRCEAARRAMNRHASSRYPSADDWPYGEPANNVVLCATHFIILSYARARLGERACLDSRTMLHWCRWFGDLHDSFSRIRRCLYALLQGRAAPDCLSNKAPNKRCKFNSI